MISRQTILVGMTVLMLAALVSCSGGSSKQENPIFPDLSPQTVAEIPNNYLLFYYNIYVNPEEDVFEVVPVRQVAEHLNIIRFLENGICTTCFKVVGSEPTIDGTYLIDVQVQHPLTSPDFTIFDVRGIMIFQGSKVFPASYENFLFTSNPSLGEGALMNPDGYTTLFNPATSGNGPGGIFGYEKARWASDAWPNSNLNGFKRHISPGPENTRNALYAASYAEAQYELKFSTGGFVFGYAVDCSWAPPLTQPVQDPMLDFPPDANALEPWKIAITQEAVDQGLTDQGGALKLFIDVYDHQGMESHFAPTVECYELFDGLVTSVLFSDNEDHSTFEVTIQNGKLAPEGDYMCLIAARDIEDGNYSYYDLTGYQIINVTVAEFSVQANNPPIAAAHADSYTPDPGQTVSFFDDSTDPDGNEDIIKWEWDFSYDPIDGFMIGSVEKNPEVEYTSEGIYKVQLRVTDSHGNSDTLDELLTITVIADGNEKPTAAAHADLYEIEVNGYVSFFDDSTDPDGYEDIVDWEWDFSFDPVDGFLPGSFEANPIVEFDTAGTYLVQLRVTDTAGNNDMLDEPLSIRVTTQDNLGPTAAAHSDVSEIEINQAVSFFDDSTDPDGYEDIVSWEWDFSFDPVDGFLPGSFESNPEVQYISGGMYEVQLRVTDSANNSDMLDEPLVIIVTEQGNQAPTAAGYADLYEINVNQDVSFTDDSTDPDGYEDIVGWEWDFSFNPVDGFMPGSFIANPQVSYISSGVYSVQLRVTDSAGNNDMLDVPLTITVNDIENYPPTAGAWADSYSPDPGQTVSFFDDSTDPDGLEDIIKWEWDFSYDPVDGFMIGSTQKNPQVEYTNEGIYTVQLRVTDTAGNADMLDEPLTITVVADGNEKPTAAAHADIYYIDINGWVNFTDDSTDPDGYADIISWEWDFSFDPVDGFLPGSFEANPQIQFVTAGTFYVQLRVTDTAGNSDMLDQPLTIIVAAQDNLAPTAAAHADPYTIDVNEVVSFFDDSTDPDGNPDIVSWEWDFSFDPVDGFLPGGFVKNPQVQYVAGGVYKVQLRVTDTVNNSDMLDIPLTIVVNSYDNQPPTAAAHADTYDIDINEVVSFFDDSFDPDGYSDIVLWEWDFSFDPVDGFNPGSYIPNPQVQYTYEGTYMVQLRVTDSIGNFDILDYPLVITVQGPNPNDPPVACGYVLNNHPNVGTLVQFYDCSYDPDGMMDIITFEWDLDGDGIFETVAKNPAHVYYSGGDIYVQHRVTDSTGNSDILDIPIFVEVNAPPVAQAVADKTVVDVGEDITLTNLSIDPDGNGPIVEVLWDLNGNGLYYDPEDVQNQDQVIVNFDSPGLYNIGLKVIDAYGLSDELDVMLQINVGNYPNQDPVAVASVNKNWAWTGQQLIFRGHHSYDLDGYIVSWDWDFDGDGIFGDPYVGGSESKPHVVYDEPGEYLVNLRVTDNDGATDTLDILIPISIFNHPGEGESGGFDD